MKRFSFLCIMLTGSLLGSSEATVKFSGNMAGVSTYIWRGIKQNNGPALQNTTTLTWKSVSAGLWSSSVDFGQDIIAETDPFVELALCSGAVSCAWGATVYSYDMFATFNQEARAEVELYGKLGWRAFKFAGYIVPEQASTKGQLVRTLYWTETSAGWTCAGISLSGMLCFGTYSSRALPTPKKKATCFTGFTMTRNIGQTLSAFLSYQRALDKDMEHYFSFGMSYVY